MAIFESKNYNEMALNGQNSNFLYSSNIILTKEYPVKIKKLWVDILPKIMAIFQQKNGQKNLEWLKFPIFLCWSYMIMHNDYPVNWDALIS